jgi:hypothetical protein
MSDRDAVDNRYELLALRLLGPEPFGCAAYTLTDSGRLGEITDDFLPKPTSRGHRGAVYLTEYHDQLLCNIVCERVPGMSAAVWHEAGNERRIPMLEAALQKLAGAVPEPPTIWYHGDRSYSKDGIAVKTVPNGMHALLQQFLDSNTSHDTRMLANVKGISNPSSLATKVIKMFGGGAVRQPGGDKGTGYFIRVRSLEKKQSTGN